jgi:ABC-2 type transport system permease protein
MKYAWLVAWREYSENAKTKGFWLGLFLMPTILFFSAQVPIWLEQKATPTRYFVLVDQSGELAPTVEKSLEKSYEQKVFAALQEYANKYASPAATLGKMPADSDIHDGSVEDFIARGGQRAYLQRLRPRLKPGAPEFSPPRRLFQRAQLPAGIATNAPLATVAEALKPYLRGEKQIDIDGERVSLSAAVLVPRDLAHLIVRPQTGKTAVSPSANDSSARPQIEYWSINASEFSLRDEIERAVNTEIRRREYLARGLDSAAIHEVEQTYLSFASLNPKKEKGQEQISTIDTVKQWAPSGFVYLLWLSIFVIIQMLLNNTIEEKSNRIIEVLLSSVTPGELMMGKLVGIAAIGLTMVGVWMSALFAILSWKSGGASHLAGQLLTVLKGSNLVPLFSIYFLLGYVMYAAFILSVGSVCNTIKEAQSYMGVLTMIMMVPLLTMTFIPKDPNGSLARLLSWIPLYTPFTMMNRATADPPLVDLIGTLVLLVLAAIGALWMSGKVFRIGILRTGQPPKVVEMLRWVLRRER